MGTHHQLFSWFDPNGHGLIGAQTGIRQHHFQNGPMVGGEAVCYENIVEVLRWLVNMVWIFQRSLDRKFSNLYDKAAFQSKLCENIHPDTTKAIISETHRPNSDIHDIRNSVNHLTIHFLIRNDIDKYIMKFEDTCGVCGRLSSSLFSVSRTHHTTCFLAVLYLLLLFCIYNTFWVYWNCVIGSLVGRILLYFSHVGFLQLYLWQCSRDHWLGSQQEKKNL